MKKQKPNVAKALAQRLIAVAEQSEKIRLSNEQLIQSANLTRKDRLSRRMKQRLQQQQRLLNAQAKSLGKLQQLAKHLGISADTDLERPEDRFLKAATKAKKSATSKPGVEEDFSHVEMEMEELRELAREAQGNTEAAHASRAQLDVKAPEMELKLNAFAGSKQTAIAKRAKVALEEIATIREDNESRASVEVEACSEEEEVVHRVQI